jgi:acyl carrier protein
VTEARGRGLMHGQILAFLESRFRASLAGRRVDADTPLFSTGIVDSFGVLELIAFLEETFGVDIDPARYDLADFDAVAKVARLVATLQSTHGPR